MNYPDWIESWWMQRAAAHFATENHDEIVERLRAAVARLSDLFTSERPAIIPDYAGDETARAAYGLFFFPQTFARTLWILDECFNRVGHRFQEHTALSSYRLLDLGCGAGAAGFAALSFFHRFSWRWCAVDRSAANLADLQALLTFGRSHLPKVTLELREGDLLDVAGVGHELWDLILISFALNEAAAQDEARALAALDGWLERLAPNGVMVISEPASQAASERLERYRDKIAANRRLRILAPCLHAKPCPMLAEGLRWCHDVRTWAPPPCAEQINRKLYRSLSHLKYSFLALAKEPPVPVVTEGSPARARLVAPIAHERGKLVTRGCAEDGRLYTYEILTRHLSGDARGTALRLERGDRVVFSDIEALRDDILRARGVARSK